MIELTNTSLSLRMAVLCATHFFLMILINWYPCTYPGEERPAAPYKKVAFTIAFFIFLIICCIDGDWYHYQEMVWNYNFTEGYNNHGEDVYGVIIAFANKNYLAFRILIWGSAFGLILQTFKRFMIDSFVAQYFLFSVFFLVFSYARVSLAMALYFYGISFILVPAAKFAILKKLAGVAIIFSSYFFHHSMALAIAVTPIIFIPLNKKTIVALCILFPVLAKIFENLFQGLIIDEELMNNEELQQQLKFYSKRTTATTNWKGILYEYSGYLRFFVPMIVITAKLYFSSSYQTKWDEEEGEYIVPVKIPQDIQRLFKITFSIIILALSFLTMNMGSNVFFYRVLFFTFIPITILCSFLADEQLITRKTFIILLLMGILAQLYRFLYSIYTHI